jgi:hypothetical protein
MRKWIRSLWNAELQQCRLDLELKRKRESRAGKLSTDLERQTRVADECLQLLQKEQHDIENLTTSSFSQFWLGLFGKMDDRLMEEKREAAEAKLKYDAAQAAIRAMEAELTEVKRELAEVQDADLRLTRLMQQKETWMRDHDQSAREELERLSEQMASNQARIAETDEARRAGQSALQALLQAEERLNSAKNWGTYDMLGGGMIATMVKHGRIDEAQDHIHESQLYLRRFADELKDLNWSVEVAAPQIGSFLTFADYFFDGFLADWMVQGKINNSMEAVRSNANQVSVILQKLDQESRRLTSESVSSRILYDQRIEQYGA